MNGPLGHVDWGPWLAEPATAGVLTDYDGTLAPIAEDRRRAAPSPGVTEVISALADRIALVAVVSGRRVEYLESQLRPSPKVRLFGLYGLESLVNGEHRVIEAAVRWKDEMAAAALAVTREAPPGLELELKGVTLSLHARRAPETMPWAQQWAAARASSTGLIAQPGRLSVELLPPVPCDKGTVVEGLAGPLSSVSFFGDDTGDLPAFRALRRLRAAGKTTIGVGVQSPEQPAQLLRLVDTLVRGPQEAVELLGYLAGVAAVPRWTSREHLGGPGH